jgi:delta-aminolevulinic acid dehydratase/porphobilinogen synthase
MTTSRPNHLDGKLGAVISRETLANETTASFAVRCPYCGADPGARCIGPTDMPLAVAHSMRRARVQHPATATQGELL